MRHARPLVYGNTPGIEKDAFSLNAFLLLQDRQEQQKRHFARQATRPQQQLSMPQLTTNITQKYFQSIKATFSKNQNKNSYSKDPRYLRLRGLHEKDPIIRAGT
jgi:hypothetical protein